MSTATTIEPTDVDVTFDPDYPVGALQAHPKNPRRHAIADPDMVASIKTRGVEHPLTILPDGTIIAGHRRVDGAKKANRKTVPVMIRRDLVTLEDQISAMLAENLHREDISEVEEAESFGLLKELGWSQKDIATKVGRSAKTVGERLKLLRLSAKSSDALHKGQMTFTDAIALSEFDDDPKLQDKLATKSGFDLKRSIENAQRDRKAQVEVDAKVAEYKADGMVEVPRPKGVSSTYQLHTAKGVRRLEDTSAGNRRASHKKCIGYMLFPAGDYSAGSVVLVCTNPTGHKKPGPTKAELAAKAQREQENAERDAAEQAQRDASTGRIVACTTMADPGTALDPKVLDTLRQLLPLQLWDAYQKTTEQVYAAVEEIPADARWRPISEYSRKAVDREAYDRFTKWISTAPASVLLRIVIAIAAARTEVAIENLRWPHRSEGTGEEPVALRADGTRYLAFLEGIGHDFTDDDKELLAAAQWAPPAEDAPTDPYEDLHLSAGDGLVRCGLPGTSGKNLTATRELDNVTCADCVDQAEDVAS